MRRKSLIPLAALCAAALAVMAAVLVYTAPSRRFTPPPFDPAAQDGVPAVPASTGYGELNASFFRFSASGALTVSHGGVDLWLTNPSGSPVWLKARILDETGALLGESGLLRPGQYVRTVALDAVPPETVPITVAVMAYEPDTYYSAGVVRLQTQLIVT